MVKSFDDPLQQINFTVDSPVSLLYYPSSSITQVSVTDSDIHWTNDVVVSGEDKLYLQEYPNPADLNSVFSNVGGGLQTFSCFYRMSPVALLGTLQIALKGIFFLNGRFTMLHIKVDLQFKFKFKLYIFRLIILGWPKKHEILIRTLHFAHTYFDVK